MMNLTELKQKTASELLIISEEMGVEGTGRSRKQDVIFNILKHKQKKERIFLETGYSKSYRTGLVFCDPVMLLTLQELMISMYLRVKLDASV